MVSILRAHYPLKVGLKQNISQRLESVAQASSALSIKSRIETFSVDLYHSGDLPLRAHYPLKVGLKLAAVSPGSSGRTSSSALSIKSRIETLHHRSDGDRPGLFERIIH